MPYNDLEATKLAFENGNIAAVIIEPVPGNMRVVPGKEGFLQGLRDLCDKYGALLILMKSCAASEFQQQQLPQNTASCLTYSVSVK